MPDNTLGTRIANAWNAFFNKDPTEAQRYNPYSFLTTGTRPDRTRMRYNNDRTIINSIFTRIAVDVSNVQLVHARLDQNGRFSEEIDSWFNECLKLSANRDQTGRAFSIDAVLTMLDEGCVALVPVAANTDVTKTKIYDIYELRTGKVLEWMPGKVRIRVYNEDRGKHQDLVMPKESVAIIENPFYSIMNQPNGTLRRLNRKLALMDITDEQNSSGKLDLIIQLPYSIRSESRRKLAEERRRDIETQLAGSKYGIAYADGTEKITQLNKSIENQLQSQVEYLTNQLFTQLGINEDVLKGTADEKTMLNYQNQIIMPILDAFADEMKRKFLTPNARTRGESVVYFQDPFKLVQINAIADIADKFTRNEILTSNEVRAIVGMKPSADPSADVLRNKNINQSKESEETEPIMTSGADAGSQEPVDQPEIAHSDLKESKWNDSVETRLRKFYTQRSQNKHGETTKV